MKAFKVTTDDTLRETVQHGSGSYPFAYYLEDIWQFDFHRIDWHWHHELEFMYVAEGTAFCLIGTDKIQIEKGNGLFINSGVLHRFEAKGKTVIPNMVFSPGLLAPEESSIYEKYIAPILQSAVTYQIFTPQTDWQDNILKIMARIFSLQAPFPANELQTVQFLLQIWDILFSHLDLSAGSLDNQRLNYRQARLQTMIQFIHDHYAQELTLEEIAASVSISKNSALNIFNTYIHITPIAYLIQYRLAKAAELLRTTEKSIASVAKEAGIADTGYFCRKFKQIYGMTPKEYRHKKA